MKCHTIVNLTYYFCNWGLWFSVGSCLWSLSVFENDVDGSGCPTCLGTGLSSHRIERV